MREYDDLYGKVDLDDPKTYSHLPNTEKELDDLMFKEIGMALTYMNHFRKENFPLKAKRSKMVQHPYYKGIFVDVTNSGYRQRLRVEKLIKDFAENRKDNYGNLQWFKEQVFLFQSETENMC